MSRIFTSLAHTIVAGLFVVLSGGAHAQPAYPAKLVRVIVPTVPGGSTNTLARLVAQKLSESMGQQVIVENHPGADTVIGTTLVAKAAPDGYTLLVPSATHVVIPLLTSTTYDPVRDFTPISTVAVQDFVMVVHPSVPAANLKEFIAFARSRPGQLNFSASGSGSVSRLAPEFLAVETGLKMQAIAYKGGGQALTDLIAGQVHMSFQTPLNVNSQINGKRLRGLATTAKNRSPALPQVPTFDEAGLPGFNHNSWQGFFAPTGTPKPIIDKLATEIAAALAAPDVREKLMNQGVVPVTSTPEQFAATVRADYAKYAKLIKVANIKLE